MPRYIFLWAALVILFGMASIWCDQQQFDAETQILIELYNATNGDNWTQKDNWLSPSVSKCQWYGLTCLIPNRVTNINLASNGLKGTLPESLGNLTLHQLFLSSNELHGSLPRFLARMNWIIFVDLSVNKFIGTIPDDYGNMNNLIGMHLFSNALTGAIPSTLANPPNLINLNLQDNQLTGTIPEELGHIAKLTHLSLASNNLTGTIPASIGQLSDLLELTLADNHLSGTIPEELTNLTKLVTLLLHSNRLSGTIPQSIGQLNQLNRLYLHENELSGSIPPSIGALTRCTQLFVQTNRLNGTIPAEIGQMINLQFVVFPFNNFTGTIPSEFSVLPHLVWLDLSFNQLYGTIPNSFGNLRVRRLLLTSNQLSGRILEGLGYVVTLTHLSLMDNQFFGTIPGFLQNLRNLESLNLARNRLTGTIPSFLGDFRLLQELSLEDNELSGTLPASFGALSSLARFNVARNRLTGTIPATFGSMTGLQELLLDDNQLSGTLPPELFSTPARSILIANNRLSGTLSPKLSTSRNIVNLLIPGNLLTGTLPPLSSVSTLRRIDVSNNDLYGCVVLPQIFTSADNGTRCNFQDNHFCCTQTPYHCFNSTCSQSTSLRVPSGARVLFDYSSAISNLVLEAGGVLVVQPNRTINVQCTSLAGEIQIDVSQANDSVPNIHVLSTRCGTLDRTRVNVTTTGRIGCTPFIDIIGNSIQGSVTCYEPEDSQIALVLGLVIPLGAMLIIGALLLTLFLIRRKKRIENLKNRVEMLTLSTAKVDKESSPPEDFTFKLLEDLPLKISNTNFKFGMRGNLLVVDQTATDSFTIQSIGKFGKKKDGSMYEKLLDKSTLVQLRPVTSHKYNLSFQPQVFEVPYNMSVEVTIRLTLTMTTKTNVSFWIELPEERLYSLIEFNAASEPSSWIDVDDVKTDGPAIGEGGFGAVFKAQYRGQQVAFKTLKMQDMADVLQREFEQEVRMMMNLHHKAILQFVGASRAPGKLAILTEFMSHGSLQSLLKGPPLDLALKIKILIDISEALQYLHDNNILHRDIKPENVLVVSTSKDALVNVKIADFGTARSATEQVTSKFTKGVGTPAYMAVEILKNEQYERSADVFSFGVLMWAVIAQQEPYNTFKYSWDVAEFILHGHRMLVPSDCPPVLAELINNCWAQNPSERPTMSQIVKILHDFSKRYLG